MQHIGVLEKAGLLISRREGRQRWNHLNVIQRADTSGFFISCQLCTGGSQTGVARGCDESGGGRGIPSVSEAGNPAYSLFLAGNGS